MALRRKRATAGKAKKGPRIDDETREAFANRDKEAKGGGAFHIPEGYYKMKSTEAKWAESDAGNPMIRWVFEGLQGKSKGKKFYLYTTMTENSFWKLDQTYRGLGLETPDEIDDIDLDEVIGIECVGAVEDDEFEGKINSKLSGLVEEGEEEDDEEEDEKPTRRASANGRAGKAKKKKDLISTEQVKEMDEDDLESCISDNELDVDLGDYKVLSKKRAAVIAALEENDLLET